MARKKYEKAHRATRPHECGARAAQRLRFAIFGEETGARLAGPERSVDEDRFDAHCDHLLVRESEAGDAVGTYRILGLRAAESAGAYYSEQELDLSRLAHLRGTLLEAGRSCIRADYATGAVVALL